MKVIISRLVEISLKRKYLEVIKREDVSERIKEVLDDETLPMDLRLEIMEEMIDNPELGLFINHLPGGPEREYPDHALDADRSYGDEKYSCTARELFKKIDEILQEKGINIGHVRELSKKRIGEKFAVKDIAETAKYARELIKIGLKIYPYLRAKGLTSDDLLNRVSH